MSTLYWGNPRFHKNAWRARTLDEHESQRQIREMTAGPRLIADGHALIVPSEWYNEDAANFWKTHGFEWVPGLKRWTRDTRQPLKGKPYTATAWLESTRREYFRFWPGLLKYCHACGQQFEPRTVYDLHCTDPLCQADQDKGEHHGT